MSTTPPTNPPTSILPTLKHLLSLLETTATTSPSSSSSALAHTRSLEIAAATSMLKSQSGEAERWAKGLPGGEVREGEIEEVVGVLEQRRGEGRRTLEMLGKLSVEEGQQVKAEAKADGDVAMA